MSGDLALVMLTGAAADVVAERQRQRQKWGDEHDDEHTNGALAATAAVLAHPQAPPPPCGCREALCPHTPVLPPPEPIRAPDWAHPLRWRHDRRRQLVIAAALIIAEIERLDRSAAPS
ncbi:MAG TPA: hypothetical protein VD931_09395 [Baekduia sp.]|nr:hypothetical protein [Baekduia sp.]